MKQCDGSEVGRPQNGTQAHDTSRELGLGRPVRVGATPFWDRPAFEPASHSVREMDPPLGDEKK